MLSDKPVVQDLTQLLSEYGVKHVVISPGSRNAPLSISFINHPDFSTYTIVDERAAAYFALGMAQQLGEPVAMCCTSGSAGLNYAPAIAEAHYQKIPLVAITADRPEAWVNHGDGQTIMQRNMFGDHVRYATELDDLASDAEGRWFNQRKINEALLSCHGANPGPVHLNLHLREDLYGRAIMSEPEGRTIRRAETEVQLSQKTLNELAEKLNGYKRVLVLTGLLTPDDDLQKTISELAQNEQAVIIAESSSNLADTGAITTIDRVIMSFDRKEMTEFQPDLLITIGTNIVSKKIKAMLREFSPQEHWHVDASGEVMDTFRCLSTVIPVKPSEALKSLSRFISSELSFVHAWIDRSERNRKLHDQWIESLEWCDFEAFAKILPAIPGDSDLQMGNSSVVRYVQLFDSRNDLRYFSNRGTSGIDGCTSTAAGAALASARLTTLISGDLSFLYDTHGLWHEHLSDKLRIIVINNGGGNIFRIIEGPEKSGVVEEAFEAPHKMDIGQVAASYGIANLAVDSPSSLVDGLKWLYDQNECAVLEVRTWGAPNAQKIKDYFRFLRS